ncbi:MAG TPA: hypothetical protein VGM07_19150 [Stellaceae bacterium]|jgi:hypothetical protein
MAEWTDSTQGFGNTQPGLDRAKDIVVEFACATQSAALSAANERKQRVAEQVGGIAEAIRSAARSLDRSQTPTAARYADRAAEQIEDLAHALRERRWGELIGDLEMIARRQPALFVTGAVAVGFLIGRFLSVSNRPADGMPMSEGGPAPVTAAISSGSGNDRLGGWTDEGTEPRELP